jgi:autotransporter-associated beta strand protein
VLTANNTYAGPTTITAGSLQLGNGGTAGSIMGDVINNGTLAINRSNTLTLAGDISGSGDFQQNGTGTTILTGNNSYGGGTTISAGILQATTNNSVGTGPVTMNGGAFKFGGANLNVANAFTLNAAGSTFDTNGNLATLSGVISGTGGLTKTGNGGLTLTNTNTYGGNTNVNAGTLQVDGSLVNSHSFVNTGGTLAGIGTVGAVTVNTGGTLAPGTPGTSGTMTVQGNLAFQSGAFYLVQVNPSTASATHVTTGGTAALAGTVNALFAAGSYIGRTYTILTSAGLGGTTFNSLATTNLPANFAASLSYTSTDVILNLTATLGAIGTGSLSGNQKNVASALNNFFNNGGALPPNFVNVFGLTGGNLANALTLLSGEAATGGQQGAFQLGGQFMGLMLDPFVDGRGGVGGANGGAIGFAPEREATLPPDIALAYASVLKAPAPAPAFEQRWSVWGSTYGGYNRTNGDPAVVGSHDLSARAGGVAAGMDYHFTRDTVMGLAFAGGGTGWSLAQGLGGGKSDAFQAGAYGVTRNGPLYLGASLAYTQHWMSTDRFAVAGDHLTARFNAESFGARAESGYHMPTAIGTLTPYAALQVQNFHTPNYRETDVNGGGFGLAYTARTASDTRSEFGTRFDKQIMLDRAAVLALRAKLAWAHDWVSDPALVAVFQALPGASFVVNGASPAKDSALVSAGSELRLANGVSLLGKFDGEFANHSSTYAGTGTVRVVW